MVDYFDLSGKVALITGGSRGLGREIALAFADHGADVVIASRKIASCELVADAVREKGRKASAIALDASDWKQMDALVDRVYAEWGRIDILVNNAGKSPSIASHEVSEDMFDKLLALNFKGPFRLAANVAHRMAGGDGGTIINISSTGALVPMPKVIPYSGAKAALNAMTVSLAREYGPKVRVNAISPGPFLTDIAKAWDEESRSTSPNSLGRPGLPEEIVTTALYLASPSSSFTTGAIVRCDGGLG